MKLDEKTQRTIIAETASQIAWKVKSSYRNPITGEWHIDFVNSDEQFRLKPIPGSDEEEFATQLKTLLGIGETSIEAEIENLRFRTPENIHSAMQRLQRFGESAVDPLIHVLLDPDEKPSFRSKIAGTLGRIGDSRAIEPLIQSLKTSNVEFRWTVIEVLGRIGNESAIPHLENLEKTDNGSFYITDDLKATIKEAATKAIEKIKKRIK